MKWQAKGSAEGSEGIVNTHTRTRTCTHARTWHPAAGGLRTGAANNSGNPAQPGPRPWGRGLQFQTRSSQVKLPSYYLNLSPSKLESPPGHFYQPRLATEKPKLESYVGERGYESQWEPPTSKGLQSAPPRPPPFPKIYMEGSPGGGKWHRVGQRQALGAVRNEDARKRNAFLFLPTDAFSCPSPPTPSPPALSVAPAPDSSSGSSLKATGPQGSCSLPRQVAHSSFHRPEIRSTAPSRKTSKGEINWTARQESHR